MCLGSLSCCMTRYWLSYSCWTDVLTFDSRILWYTEEFMVDSMTVRCPGPVATSPISSSLHQHVWILLWGADVLFRFSPNVAQCIMAPHLHFGRVCSKYIVLEVSLFDQMQLCKHKSCCHVFFFFLEERLSSGKPSKHAIIVLYFSNCTVMNFTRPTNWICHSWLFHFGFIFVK